MSYLPPDSVQLLQTVAKTYCGATMQLFPRRGAWRQLTEEEFWKSTVYQIAVVGSAEAKSRLEGSPMAQRALSFETLRQRTPAQRLRAIHLAFRQCGVRYTAEEIASCRKSRAVERNFQFLASYPKGPIQYFHSIARLRPEMNRVENLARDLSYIKLKGARDLLISVGLARNVIAFDTRILGILKMAGVAIPEDVQQNADSYSSLEEEIVSKVCKPIKLTGAKFDRILFHNTQKISKVLAQ